MKKYSVILIGAGIRGTTYTNKMLALKDQFKVVGVAEPIENRRNNIKNKLGLVSLLRILL